MKSEDLGLSAGPGLGAGTKLEGKRALNALLRPVTIPEGDVVLTPKPMNKYESGIPRRRLFPLDYEFRGLFEVVETAAKPFCNIPNTRPS